MKDHSHHNFNHNDMLRSMKDSMRSGPRAESGGSNDMVYTLLFIVVVLGLRILARYYLMPTQHKMPPKESMELFSHDRNNGALACLKRNEEGQISLKLKTKIKISQDTFIFRFEFPHIEMSMGLPIGNHVMFHATIKGEEVVRKYTPISAVKDQTFVDFVIKIYRKNAKFPEGGLMTQYLEKM